MCDMEEYSSILSCPSRKPLDANYIMVSSAILSALSDYHILVLILLSFLFLKQVFFELLGIKTKGHLLLF